MWPSSTCATARGIAQVVVRENDIAHDLRAEYCVRVVGEVRVRPEGNRNDAIPTGAVEVAASEVEVLSAAAPLPFPLDDDVTVGDEVRLKYRYLDLRRASSAKALRTRSLITRSIRRVMDERDFLDIETPTLTRSTPEGARDFLVPVRLQPGSWYALPQSPQLFKQLLMVAGMERYYQIARCYRDEDFRADRQPEFTQLDIEMSFPDEEDLYELTEAVMTRIWSDVLGVELSAPFPRMTYDEAMRRFGVDRPDVRFGVELVDVTGYFAETPFRVFQAAHVGAVVMPGGAAQARKTFDAWQEWAKQRGAKGLAYVTFLEDGTLGGPVAKNLSESEREGLRAAVGAQVGDCAFFGAGPRTEALALLGATRLEIGKRLGLLDDSRWEFLWVTDFPMFEPVLDPSGGQRRLDGRAPPVHRACPEPRGHVRDRPGRRAGAGVRPDPQRLRARRRLHPHPLQRRAAPGLRRHRPHPRAGQRAVRLPARGVLVRPAAARRHRVRHRPHRGDGDRERVDPRRHRVPEDRRRRRPAHGRAHPDHRAAAGRGRDRRAARGLTATSGPAAAGGRW